MIRAIALAVGSALLTTSGALAGVWVGSLEFEPFLIVHPIGYDGTTGGVIQIRVCAQEPILIPAISAAIQMWNDLSPTTGNCQGNCQLIEDPELSDPPAQDMSSVVAHELGHCAFGLDHINWESDSSFTASQNAASIIAGADSVRGSRDDLVSPLPGTRVLHWFRIIDNDPFEIDGLTIDRTSYSRRILDLPVGSSWQASANKGVAEALGIGADSQSLMYSLLPPGIIYTGIVSDDANTVEYGMTGNDEIAGTSDDYTVALELVDSCSAAEIEVRFIDLSDPDLLGRCRSAIQSVQTGGGLDIHQALVPETGQARLLIEINSIVNWSIVFADGFESGNTSGWSETNP